jgi:SagB-type dehydrogenase family enzyme
MPSFTERYHEYTKYNPQTIGRLHKVNWEESPDFYDTKAPEEDKIPLLPWLNFLNKPDEGFDWMRVKYKNNLPNNSLSIIAPLLYFTNGVTSLVENGADTHYLRANPSAGGVYPSEIYVIIKNSLDIPKGIYHFHPLFTALYPIKRIETNFDINDLAASLFQMDSTIEVAFVFTSDYSKTKWRYGERSYRRMLLDNGHSVANMEIFCQFHGLNFEIHNDFCDDHLSDFLKLKQTEVPLTAITFSQGLKKDLKSPEPIQAYANAIKNKELFIQQNIVEKIHIEAPIQKLPMTAATNQVSSNDIIIQRGDSPTHPVFNIRIRRSTRVFKPEKILYNDFLKLFSWPMDLPNNHAWDFELSDCYIVCAKVDSIPAGIYKYTTKDKLLKFHSNLPNQNLLQKAFLEQDVSLSPGCFIIYTADISKAINIAGDRIYRHLHSQAGRIGQRIAVALQNTPLGTSGIGGFLDNQLNYLLKIDSKQIIVYSTAFGVAN